MEPNEKISSQWKLKNFIFLNLIKIFYEDELTQNYFELNEKFLNRSKFSPKKIGKNICCSQQLHKVYGFLYFHEKLFSTGYHPKLHFIMFL